MDLLQTVVSSASSPSSPPSSESSNGDLVNLDDSTASAEHDVYEDFAVRKLKVVDETDEVH